MNDVLRIMNYCSCWQHAALRASQFGPLRLWLWQLCFRVSSLRWLTTSSLDHLHLLHFLDPFFEEANNIISSSSFPSTLSSLLSYTFWGRQHPLFSILTFFLSFLEEAGNIFFNPLWCLPLFWGRQHPPLIILNVCIFIGRGRKHPLIFFYFLSCLLRSTKCHFDPLFTIFDFFGR